MTLWRFKINIKDLLSACRDGTASFEDTKKAVCVELRRVPPFRVGRGKDLVDELEQTNGIGDFDLTLDDVYDHADRQKVWLGFGSGLDELTAK